MHTLHVHPTYTCRLDQKHNTSTTSMHANTHKYMYIWLGIRSGFHNNTISADTQNYKCRQKLNKHFHIHCTARLIHAKNPVKIDIVFTCTCTYA